MVMQPFGVRAYRSFKPTSRSMSPTLLNCAMCIPLWMEFSLFLCSLFSSMEWSLWLWNSFITITSSWSSWTGDTQPRHSDNASRIISSVLVSPGDPLVAVGATHLLVTPFGGRRVAQAPTVRVGDAGVLNKVGTNPVTTESELQVLYYSLPHWPKCCMRTARVSR